ncbi:hypothetical protein RMN56_19515 [Micromonospora halotolerans]|uniref:Uncharacterized protein n=1 Tax=Micromonospora halotolerans TaxID=709879 RepID=A0ABY9ZSM5_9ACTN|nr:hypothetical protein [Micromonospora halotolerans]WNM37356.1 hypothetical protein RMN56_19515 [Micromonospora halotolerans]
MSDIADIANDDPRRIKALRGSLDRLANSQQPELREMARAVLNGDITLRTAGLTSAYGPALSDAFGSFWTYYRQLDPEERQQLEATAYVDDQDVEHRAGNARP